MSITARLEGGSRAVALVLHYRPLDQTQDWRRAPMLGGDDGEFRAEIPGGEVSARHDLQYYFEIVESGGAAWLRPSWQAGVPYYVIEVRD
jgi:hypothetical protein